ncbi:MAG: tRNA (adenosine(37)-N6)-dimethylallyltransferase MiaA [Patescibacteria group bacterium]
MSKPSIIVILGPTASGKSALAVRLATKLDGEIISADSRQVYRGLDIGTAKIARREMGGVPHHLLDVASPRRVFSVARYQILARRAIQDILRRGKFPIICGGTGQYIDAVLGAAPLPNVPPDPRLRAKLEKLSPAELFTRLKKLDPRRADAIDRHNPRRLVRALEIVITTGKPVPQAQAAPHQHSNILKNVGMLKILKVGLFPGGEVLRQRINARLAKDLRRGLIREVKNLHAEGLMWKRLDELGLEYRYVAKFLRGEIKTKSELETKLQTELWRYAKRQMTWFKQDINIIWLKNPDGAEKLVRKFLHT